MKITLENTTRIVEVMTDNGPIACRVWEGESEGGIPCVAMIVRVAVQDDADERDFAEDLQRTRDPSPAVAALPLRLII